MIYRLIDKSNLSTVKFAACYHGDAKELVDFLNGMEPTTSPRYSIHSYVGQAVKVADATRGNASSVSPGTFVFYHAEYGMSFLSSGDVPYYYYLADAFFDAPPSA